MVQTQSDSFPLPVVLLSALFLILTPVKAQSADACDLPGVSCPPATLGQCNSNVGFPYYCFGANLCCTLPAVCITFKSSYVCIGGVAGGSGVSSTPKVAGGGVTSSSTTPPSTPKTSISPSPTSLLTTTSRPSTSVPPLPSPSNTGAGIIAPLPSPPSTPITPVPLPSVNTVTSRSSTPTPPLPGPNTVTPGTMGGSNNNPSIPATSATRIPTTISPASPSVAQGNIGGNGGAAGGQTGAGSGGAAGGGQTGAGGQTLGNNGGSGPGLTMPAGGIPSTITSVRPTTLFTAAATPRHVVGWHGGLVVVVAGVFVAGVGANVALE